MTATFLMAESLEVSADADKEGAMQLSHRFGLPVVVGFQPSAVAAEQALAIKCTQFFGSRATVYTTSCSIAVDYAHVILFHSTPT